MSQDTVEPPEKRSRGEEAIDDGMLFPFLFPFLFFHESFCFDLLPSFFSAEDDGLMMPEVPADEAVTDPIMASEEKC